VSAKGGRLRLKDGLRVASVGLCARPLCAALSALGIAIGTAAIVGVLGLSSSSRAGLIAEIDRLGTNMPAAYAGTAPLEASSAGQVRHLLNRGGNRQLNKVIHQIAVTQARCSPPARAYPARRQQEGKTKKEALRALKRYIVRAVRHLWQTCLALRQTTAILEAA
jgi:ABC-type antimicrobial peptide transport system permease subunit